MPPVLGAQSLNHWTTREEPHFLLKKLTHFFYCLSQSGFLFLLAKSILNYMNIMVIAYKPKADPHEEQESRTRKLSEIKIAPLSSSLSLSFESPDLSTWSYF